MEGEKLSYADYPFLKELDILEENLGCYNGKTWGGSGDLVSSVNPHNNKAIARVKEATEADYEECIKNMEAVKDRWMSTPMPQRGLIVQQIGEVIKSKKEALGRLVTLEMGKILAEGLGEVQEFIDICDYAVGLSRTLCGKTIPSERDNHTIIENWNPLGLIGVITAFNFPCAVLGWNTAISLVCGDLTVWKPAQTTSLVSIATAKIICSVLEKNGFAGVFTLALGPGQTVGEKLIHDERLRLVSFTGSTGVGRRVSSVVHARFGRTILELGGNNATIILEDADLDMALKAVVFAAVGTCGQRCTSLRRLVLQEKVFDQFVGKLMKVYETIKIGDPFDQGNLCGPLHTKSAVKQYEDGLEEIKKQGGKILCGGKKYESNTGGNYVYPTIVEIDSSAEIIKKELFVPILFVLKCKDFQDAVRINNSVPQGLSSSLFSTNMKNVFNWIGPLGSDCGLVNVNISTSGAEIGGAFGGEKETGGGRESGGDAWKQYMRQTTCTINYGNYLPLAQGVKFEI